MGRLRRGGGDFDFLFDMEPSESLEEEESIGEEDVSTVEGEEGGEEHIRQAQKKCTGTEFEVEAFSNFKRVLFEFERFTP